MKFIAMVSDRNMAFLVFGPDGRILAQSLAGYADSPDPPPALPPIPGPAADLLKGRVTTLPSIDDTMRYRVLIRNGPRDTTIVTAASLDPVDDAVNSLVRTLLLAGLLALAGASLLSWLVIRRGLRPVDRMVDTAAAIADGDLSRRVPDAGSAAPSWVGWVRP